MANHIEKHPTLPIIIRRYSNLNISEVDPEAINETVNFINAQTEKIYYVIDVSDIRVSLEDLTKAGGMASAKNSTLSNENIIETLVIVPNRLIELAAQG